YDPVSLRELSRGTPFGSAPGLALVTRRYTVAVNAADGTLTKISPSGRRSTIAVSAGLQAYGSAYSTGRLWIATHVDGSVAEVDPERMVIERVVHLTGWPVDVVAGAGSVWALTERPSRIYRIDPKTARVLGRSIAAPAKASSLSFGAGALWVGDGNAKALVRFAPTSPAPGPAPLPAQDRILRAGPVPVGKRLVVTSLVPHLSIEAHEPGWLAFAFADVAQFEPLTTPGIGLTVVALDTPAALFDASGRLTRVRTAAQFLATLRRNPGLTVSGISAATVGGVQGIRAIVRAHPRPPYSSLCQGKPCVLLFPSKQGTDVLAGGSTDEFTVLAKGGKLFFVDASFRANRKALLRSRRLIASIRFEREERSDPRAGRDHGRARRVGELLEVLAEHAGELRGLAVVRVRVAPRASWIEQRVVHTRYRDGHFEAEDRVDAVLDAPQALLERGAEKPTGRGDRHPVPLAEGTSRPARVHEPHGHVRVRVELLAEHARVERRRLRQERRAEAGREGRLRLGDADLRARHLRRVAGQEVEQGLVAGQPGDRREDAERVGGEHDHRARMTGPLRRQRVRDLLELVGGARVLGLRVVVEVEDPALVDGHVLEDGPERPRRAVDLRLCLGGEPDHLRVAAALQVEDAAVAPAVLVVADQRPLRIGGEGRLAGTRQPEEDRHAAVVVDVRRAVHGKDALERKLVVHQREDRLLDLAAVEGPADQNLLARRVQDDEHAGSRPVFLRVRRHLRGVEDERVGLEALQLGRARLDEHRPREQGVVRPIGDHADGHAVRRVGPGVRVDDVDVARVQVRDELRAQPVEVLLVERLVDRPPPDALLRFRLPHDELVLGRAPREAPRVDDERTALGEPALAPG